MIATLLYFSVGGLLVACIWIARENREFPLDEILFFFLLWPSCVLEVFTNKEINFFELILENKTMFVKLMSFEISIVVIVWFLFNTIFK